jgi:hypothetical protein
VREGGGGGLERICSPLPHPGGVFGLVVDMIQ